MNNKALPSLTPDRVIEWHTRASGYFSCINLDQLNHDASLAEIKEAFESDLYSLESINVEISHLTSHGWAGACDDEQ